MEDWGERIGGGQKKCNDHSLIKWSKVKKVLGSGKRSNEGRSRVLGAEGNTERGFFAPEKVKGR